MIPNGSLKEIFFTTESPFLDNCHEAISVTGCTQYLAISKHNIDTCISTIALLNRQGRFLSQVSDSGVIQKQQWRGNPIHRMEFCSLKKCVFIVAQNLFSAVSLYVVNPKKTAVIHLIREIMIKKDDLIRALVSLPDGQMISGSQSGTHRMLQVRFSS